jgi:PKHD-type hydroxylase
MNLEHYSWIFQKAIPNHICDEIVAYAKTKIKQKAITGDFKSNENLNKPELKKLHKTRNSDVIWLDDFWIYKEIYPFVQNANKNANWNFDIHKCEKAQFTIYEENQHYDWHWDCWKHPYNIPNSPENGLIRKISVTVSLSDLSEYEGGDFLFDFRDGSPIKKKRIFSYRDLLTKGSILVFPSFLWHKVKPVIKGKRYSLVVWYLGKPFK